MLVAGALGLEEEQMAHGGLLALASGLIVTVPTVVSGVADWLEIPNGTPARTMATIHLVVMLLATAVFALTFMLQLDGYRQDQVTTEAWIAGVAALAVLVAGGYGGGALAFVYGVRVIGRRDIRLLDAVIPGRTGAAADGDAPGGEQAGEMARGPEA